jgi:predicted RNA-binding protein YlxR (DUF448 family)
LAPVRTCVACREAAGPEDLVRLVAHPETGRVIVDYRGKLPGRGAWVHPSAACVRAVEQQPGRLRRTLKVECWTEGLSEQLLGLVEGAVLDGLSIAAASGSLVGGHDRLRAALEAGEIAVVAVAAGASDRTLQSLAEVAGDVSFIPISLDAGELGDRIGRGARAALGVLSTRPAGFLVRQLKRLTALRGG